MAKKVAEEAVELSLAALRRDRRAAIRESADLLDNITALWVALGIAPSEVWSELDRRERL
jgi:phosphoribosyl-ATP pyrophosphohydrolase